ncbi:hypothetical protein M5689_023279 [Euphorbia peplus]|nr:hypothetical protein M5689_023279 [Euphorbia peplus]
MSCSYFRGLGYGCVANDFTLVVSMDRIKYNIFSLKEDAWKTITCPLASEYYHPDAIEDPLHRIMHWHSHAIVLNGIFHWLVALANNDCEIVAFDVGKVTFKKLQLPQQVYRAATLLEHEGCLCISFSKKIWMMEEYGVWVHLLTVKNSSSQFNCFELPVLCISASSEVVFHADEKFSRCGREEEDKLDRNFATFPRMYWPVRYVETLVSPNMYFGLERNKGVDRLFF